MKALKRFFQQDENTVCDFELMKLAEAKVNTCKHNSKQKKRKKTEEETPFVLVTKVI